MASATHFFTCEVLAAPASFLSAESALHFTCASFWHLPMKLVSAAPASFLSAASDLQVAKAGTETRQKAKTTSDRFIASSDEWSAACAGRAARTPARVFCSSSKAAGLL